MSLDVYLEIDNEVEQIPKIYVREGGRMIALNNEEWADRYPDREPVVVSARASREVFSANITHNLAKMASEAGIYKHLWRPDEIEIERSDQLIEPLRAGLELLQKEPERFKAFNPENGWGDYEGLVRFVEDYLAACQEWPDAKVSIWR